MAIRSALPWKRFFRPSSSNFRNVMKPGSVDHGEVSSAGAKQVDAAFESMVRRTSFLEAVTEEARVSTVDVHVKLVCCSEDQAAADRLVALCYASRGYLMDPEAGNVPSDQGLLSAHLTFLACRDHQKVGTLTIGLDQDRGLLADEANRAIVDGLRRSGRRVAELRRLAVHDPVDSKAVLAHLFRAVYCAGRLVHGATDVLIEVNPRHANFYARIFGFVRLGDEKICARVRAPAVLMRLDIADLDRRLSRLFAAVVSL